MTSAHPVMVPPRARGPVLVMFSIKSNLRKDSCSEFGVGKKTRGSRDTHMHVNTEEALIRHQQPWDARQGGRARGELRPASGARNRKPMAPSAVPATGPAGPGGAARHRPIRHARWVRETRNAENNWTRASTQRKTVHVYDKSAPQNFGCTGRGESVLAITRLDIRQRVLVADPLCCTGLMFVEIPRHLPTK